jgi:putative phosphonate catabolism associated alcohol dehydrogenase
MSKYRIFDTSSKLLVDNAIISRAPQDKSIVSSTHQPTTAKAAVFRAVRAPCAIEQFSIPALLRKETLVKIRCATICGSDLHSYYGRRHSPMPCILGHEMVGEVVATGPDGTRDYRGALLQEGDRITWSMVWSCGECFYCRRGLRPKCERLMKFGHDEMAPGRELRGGMAEYCVLPAGTAIFKVPTNVADAVASTSNCATATVAAVLRHAGSVAEQTILVHGAGMLGQTACSMANWAGASQVIVVEPDARRRETALAFGATEALDSAQPRDQLAARVLELTDGRGADVAVELSGVPDAIELGVGLLRFGGRFILAGSTYPSRPVQLNAEQVVRRLLQIIGVYNYNPEDLETALRFLSEVQDRYPFEQLVGKTFSLNDVNEAFDYAERQRPPRVAVIP